MSDLFAVLCARLSAHIDRRGWAHVDCPACGKEAARGQSHFSFNEEYGHCFVCGFSASLKQLADRVSAPLVDAPRVNRMREAPRPKHWQTRPEYYLDRFCGALDRVQRWTEYKPLTLDSIARFRLGVGVLPASRCEKRRLIVPVFSCGRIVAFHGRAYRTDDADAKWLSAGGSSKQVLFNADALVGNPTVVICENFVDAILVMQAEPAIVAVCGGGANWREEWTAQIAQARPRHVLVLLDNDLAGWPEPQTYELLSAQWRRDHPDVKAPEPRGPKIASSLLAAGIRSVRGPSWPPGTPPKYDIGQDLARRAA